MSCEYENQINKGRSLIKKCSCAVLKINPSEELIKELHLMREILTKQKGQYKDPDADDYIYLSWTKYCEEIGITYQIANYWLEKVFSDGAVKTRRKA